MQNCAVIQSILYCIERLKMVPLIEVLGSLVAKY